MKAEEEEQRRLEAERKRAIAREKEKQAQECDAMALAEKDMRVFLYNEQKFIREQVCRIDRHKSTLLFLVLSP